MTTKEIDLDSLTYSSEEKSEEKKQYRFTNYLDSIIKYLTNTDNKFYFDIKWISPMRFQLIGVYYVKIDCDVKYLRKFKCKNFFYKRDELKLLSKNNRPTTFECFKNENFEFKPINKLPYDVY